MPPEDLMRPPEPSDDAVQTTHVDAALAKISCARLGYFQDPWTEQLMRSMRPMARSPLIHRGYYSRVAAIRQSIVKFLAAAPPGDGVQIVCLGSGFDTTYFWLRDNPTIWRNDLVYFEMDFPEILSKKANALLKKQNLWPMVDATTQEELVGNDLTCFGTRAVRTPHLKQVPADLRITNEARDGLIQAGFRGDVPTLFISECVLVYMQSNHADSIIEWAASMVPDAPAGFVVYEQTNPNDAFGKVMIENLMRRGCPLQSVHDYPSMASQDARYRQRGWDQVAVSDMNEVYNKYTDPKDVARIQRLELLDEFEEWHLIQGHYFLLTATKGDEGQAWIHNIPLVPSPAAAAAAAIAAVVAGGLPNAD